MRIGIVGADGRMGQTLVRTVVAAEGCELIGAISKHDSPAEGMDAGMVAGLDPRGVRIGEASDSPGSPGGPTATMARAGRYPGVEGPMQPAEQRAP